MAEDFKWSDVAEDTIVQSTGAIAVYLNPHGDVVVRQQSTSPYQDEDHFVTVPPVIVSKLIRKLQQILEERGPDAQD